LLVGVVEGEHTLAVVAPVDTESFLHNLWPLETLTRSQLEEVVREAVPLETKMDQMVQTLYFLQLPQPAVVVVEEQILQVTMAGLVGVILV
jgi:hypothetical protein